MIRTTLYTPPPPFLIADRHNLYPPEDGLVTRVGWTVGGVGVGGVGVGGLGDPAGLGFVEPEAGRVEPEVEPVEPEVERVDPVTAAVLAGGLVVWAPTLAIKARLTTYAHILMSEICL